MDTQRGKWFFCDLDGVLVQSNGRIREEDINQIKEFIANDGNFVICTGRLDQDIKYVENKIGVKGTYRISQNGTVIRDVNNEIVHHETIDKQFIKIINDVLIDYEVRTEVNDINNRYYPSPRNPEDIAEFVDTSIVENDLFDYVENNLEPTIYLNFGHVEQFNKIKEKINEILADKVTVSQTSPTSLEIFSDKASKGSAVKYILSKENVEKQDVIVAGDAESDITMFPFSKLTFAVGEYASEEIIRDAKYHVNSIEQIIKEYL